MGTDIRGFPECRSTYRTLDVDDASRHAAISLDLLYGGRDYEAFGCLFGVRNHAGFRPLAGHRDLPPDAAAGTRAEFGLWGRDAHGASWIGWPELTRVDWSEPAERPDERADLYRRGADGDWVFSGKVFPDRPDRAEGETWERDGVLLRMGRMTRREAVPADGEWRPVWATMGALAEVHGDENVRLVVWFDN
ncbi:hypothetical protein ACFY8W_26980 [Streptomyces sp. NPDC012637]|uniref:hypothetical protein n=1 Tax=Streptomyces sp. NPDC012637 TaxID=3364842 RepID=UPI0036E787A4